MARSKHKFWTQEYVIAVASGSHTKYFYGHKLKDALASAGKKLSDGKVFSYAKFVKKGKTTVAELRRNGRVVHTY